MSLREAKNEHVFIKFVREREGAGMMEELVFVPCLQSFYMCSESSLDVRMRLFLTVKWASKKMKRICNNFL
jgi:hypothetical protein